MNIWEKIRNYFSPKKQESTSEEDIIRERMRQIKEGKRKLTKEEAIGLITTIEDYMARLGNMFADAEESVEKERDYNRQKAEEQLNVIIELKSSFSDKITGYFEEQREIDKRNHETLEKKILSAEKRIEEEFEKSRKMIGRYIANGLEKNREEMSRHIENNKKEFEGLKEMIRQDFMRKTAEISREYKFVEEQSNRIGELYSTIKNRDSLFEMNIKELTEETKSLNENYMNLALSMKAMKDVICEIAESKGIELKIAEKGIHLWLYEKLYEHIGENVRYLNIREMTDDIMRDAQKNKGIN